MRVYPFLVVCLCSFFLAACGESTHSVTSVAVTVDADKHTPASPSQIRIALIMKTLTNPFFIEMEKGARKAGNPP